MGYFPVRYDSRVVIYERKMFIRFATGKFLVRYDSRVVNYNGRTLTRLSTLANLINNLRS